jgi:hypothetical protein
MSNLSDKDIDRLSRDAAEFYEPDHTMLSWKKLEQNLVEQIPERPPDFGSLFRIRPLVWAPAVLLLTGITYYLIKNTNHRQISTLKSQTEVSHPVPATLPENSRLPGNSPDAAAHASSSASAEGKAGKENTPLRKNAASSGGTSGKKDPDALERRYAPAGNFYAANAKNKAHRTNGIGSGVEGRAGDYRNNQSGKTTGSGTYNEDKTADPGGRSGGDMAAGMSAAGSRSNAHGKTAYAVNLPLPSAINHTPLVSGNDSSLNRFAATGKAVKKNGKSLQINRSLVLGLVMGPDYSDVGGMSNDQLGNNLGISVGYYLSSRLSLNTGIQYTIKNYWTEGKYFQPGNSGLTPAYAFPRIESVNGSSNMFEIPLTLRYDFLKQEKARFFVNAGFSSYLMRKETYTFFFHNAGRAYQWQNQNNQHRNYWFAVASLSAGFEQDLGKGFSFQTEPFLRLPLQGIGDGNIKLNSYGLLFSIRYTPVLGRTRK